MAKTSQVLRDQRRIKLIKKYAERRAALRKKLNDSNVVDRRQARGAEEVREAAAQFLPDAPEAPLQDHRAARAATTGSSASRASRCATSG